MIFITMEQSMSKITLTKFLENFWSCIKINAFNFKRIGNLQKPTIGDLKRNELKQSESIYAEHLYKNMTGLINEIRVVDKTVIVLTGAMWTWLLSDGHQGSYILFLLPAIMTMFFTIKTFKLMSEFHVQRRYYFNLFIGDEVNKKGDTKCDFIDVGGFNKIFYYLLILFNLLLGIFFLCK